jgi:hypothetical protein
VAVDVAISEGNDVVGLDVAVSEGNGVVGLEWRDAFLNK